MYQDVAEEVAPGDLLQVNTALHPRLRVTPLKEGEIAKYRLVMADRDDITRTEESSGKKMKHQQVYSFVGRKRIYDPFNKRKIEIKNVTSWKPEKLPSGEVKDIPITSRILFPRTGEIILTDRDNEQFAFMERMDENASNEWRDVKGPKPKFYRVDVKKQTMKELEKDYLIIDALNWVKEANETELQTIHKGLDAETKKPLNADSFEQLKRGLLKLSQENPILVLKASTNKMAKVKVQCMEAERFKVIAFDEGDNRTPRRWIYVEGRPQTMCEIAPGVNKVDGLVKFFIEEKEGKEWYTKMALGLKDILEVRR